MEAGFVVVEDDYLPSSEASSLVPMDATPQSAGNCPMTMSVNAIPSDALKNSYDVLVSVKVPDQKERTPMDVCAVIDISGSMSNAATMTNSKGDVESHGMSLLDVVKHAVRTIISTLTAGDRLALVTYSCNARTEIGLTTMNAQGKKQVLDILEKLHTEGRTNLWDGLHTGLELLRPGHGEESKRLPAVLLLTDGLPNVEPPRGHVPALQHYKEQHKSMSASINTFGFGFSVESQLLHDLATEAGGLFYFIPDSSFVGTSFVNAMSNLGSTAGRNVTLSLEPQGGGRIERGQVLGGHLCDYASWGVAVHCGALQAGQTKDVVVRLASPPSLGDEYLVATLKYDTPTGSGAAVTTSVHGWDLDGRCNNEIKVQRSRLEFVNTLKELLQKTPDAAYDDIQLMDLQSRLTSLSVSLSTNVSPDARLSDLLKDLNGQVLEAFSKQDWYGRWGRHWLLSISRAHLYQQCTNFKDPGLQHYGGKLFGKLRDEADAAFCKLPPPKPSLGRGSRPAVRSMSGYHNRSNPCFEGGCLVKMDDGSLRRVDQVFKGDMVVTDAGTATVRGVLKTLCAQDACELVALGDLLVTPWHPVHYGGAWQFPVHIPDGTLSVHPCPAVYSFVLDADHSMVIGGVVCVTLGHGATGDVREHPYFGTQKVVDDVSSMSGWASSSGVVVLQPGCTKKDQATGFVCGLLDETPNTVAPGLLDDAVYFGNTDRAVSSFTSLPTMICAAD